MNLQDMDLMFVRPESACYKESAARPWYGPTILIQLTLMVAHMGAQVLGASTPTCQDSRNTALLKSSGWLATCSPETGLSQYYIEVCLRYTIL